MAGSALEANKQIASQISNIGHLVGNYGYSGKDLLASRDAITEVRATDLLLMPHIKGNRFLFSAPDGQYSKRLQRLLNDAGLNKYVGPIQATTDLLGSSFQSDQQCWQNGDSVSVCAQNYLDAVRNLERGIIAFHDTTEQSLALIQELIPILEAESYNFIPLQEIPSVNFSLRAAGATPSASDEDTCNDYE